jgi:hypothetical protein
MLMLTAFVNHVSVDNDDDSDDNSDDGLVNGCSRYR